MNGMRILSAVSVLTLGVQSVSAAKLSGAYAFASTEMCEAQLSVVKDVNGKVTDVNLSRAGVISSGNGVVTFTPTSASDGTLTITNAKLIEGGTLRVGQNGQAWGQHPDVQSNVPYSFRATTLTVGSGPSAQVNQMVCGDVVSGVCRGVFLLRRDTVPGNPNCVVAVSAVKR